MWHPVLSWILWSLCIILHVGKTGCYTCDKWICDLMHCAWWCLMNVVIMWYLVNLLNASYLIYVVGELGDLCELVSLVNCTHDDIWWICEDVYLLMFIVNGDTCTCDDFNWWCLFSAKIMKYYMNVIYDSFGDNDFLVYTLK